jgi:hypothetical protein
MLTTLFDPASPTSLATVTFGINDVSMKLWLETQFKGHFDACLHCACAEGQNTTSGF